MADGTIAFTASSTDTTNATIYTFTGVAIGAAASDRYVAVAINGESGGASRSVSGVTIGGVTAASWINNDAAERYVSIWYANVPTGTTATIVVTASGAGWTACEIGVYRITGLTTTTANATLIDTSTPGTGGIAVDAGGAIIAISKSSNSPTTCTWTNLTEDYDGLGENFSVSGASLNPSTAQTVTITATWASENTPVLAAVALDLNFTAPATASFLPTLSLLGVG